MTSKWVARQFWMLFVKANQRLAFVQSPATEGAHGSADGTRTALQAGRSRFRFPMVSLEFFIDINLPAALWPWGRFRNEYEEYFLGGKGGRCVGLTTLSPSYAECLEVWEPQPAATLQACNKNCFISSFFYKCQKYFCFKNGNVTRYFPFSCSYMT